MSLSNLYTITDKVAKKSAPVFQQATNLIAIRHFNGFLHQLPLFMRPDYELVLLGEFNDENRFMVVHEQPTVIATGEAVAFSDERNINE